MAITPFHACFYAHELTRLGAVGDVDRLSTTLFDSKVDLNPHQVEAALFAIANPLQKGVILADEVGLGKTIEAGLVLCQRWAERRRRMTVVCPAHIRKQWQAELTEKFNLPAIVLDRRICRQLRDEGHINPFDCGKIVVISYGFAARMKDDLRATTFDLVVLDEAHKLRNAYQASHKGGQAVRWAFELRQKILLTATPLQNSLLELFGLGWIIDDHLFGDRSAFQSRYCNAGGDLAGLRARLSQVCKRTLRKDCAYVRFTKRQALTHPFKQTENERTLHADVLDFMRREISYALPQRQRQLIEMILFKTLASSPNALASTLHTMRKRLITLRDGLPTLPEGELVESLTHDDDLDLEDLVERIDDLDTPVDQSSPVVVGRLLAEELAQIDSLISRAERIGIDSKSTALLKALDIAFARLQSLGAKRKALIFTESRKTQAFLAAFLEANGYAGKVVTFNGSNTHPSARQAYDRFTAKHAGTDKLTGSKSVDIRSALIEEFHDNGEILLATEAAAEGVNLQFCSLVVNYDLPWNPQRIEQRIGRCHRYGQEHDVVVVNFLSQDNLADQRVQNLLQQKFSLFDGLFGASDEVLGAIDDGVDFEMRVLTILKSCRTDLEIQDAFDSLQRELEGMISQKMTEARQNLFEHFDADVHERLRIRGDAAQQALDRVGDRFWHLAHWGLDGHVTFDDDRFGFYLPHSPAPGIPVGEYRLMSAARTDEAFAATEAHLLRLSSPLGEWLLNSAKAQDLPTSVVRFNVTNHNRKISMLQPLVGQAGWLRLSKLTIDTDAREEFLLLSGCTDDGRSIEQEVLLRLFDVEGIVCGEAATDAVSHRRLAEDSHRLEHATTARAIEAGNGRFRQIQAQINQWADDRIKAAELALDSIKRDLRAARRQADMAESTQSWAEAEERIRGLEAQQRRQRKVIFDVEDEVEAQRVDLIEHLKQRITYGASSKLIFDLRWEVV